MALRASTDEGRFGSYFALPGSLSGRRDHSGSTLNDGALVDHAMEKELQKLNRSFTDRFFWPRNAILLAIPIWTDWRSSVDPRAATAARPSGQIQVRNVGEGGWLHPRCEIAFPVGVRTRLASGLARFDPGGLLKRRDTS